MRLVTALLFLFITGDAYAQGTGFYFKNFVRHADGSECRHTAGEAGFTAYLNGDPGAVLFENAPRWEDGAEPNIAGNGTFGLQLGNFPALADGDSVTVAFYCLATNQQGSLTAKLNLGAPPPFPVTLTLDQATAALNPPGDIRLHLDDDALVLDWTPKAETGYFVYRRAGNDTLSNGAPRRLYERVAQVDAPPFRDTTSGAFGYVVVPVQDGTIGPHSAEASNLPVPPDDVVAFVHSLDPLAVQIRWAPAGNLEGATYQVSRQSSGHTPVLFEPTNETWYLDTDVEHGRTYTYHVSVLHPSGTFVSEGASLHVRVPIVEDGFSIEILADHEIEHPTDLAWGPDGRLYFTELTRGQIKAIRFLPDDGSPAVDYDIEVFADGFNQPVGIAWQGDALYVSWRGSISIVRDKDGDGRADARDDIITGWDVGWHQNNQIVFDEEGYFYVSLGAIQDRTEDHTGIHNKLLRIAPDGQEIQIWARGIRNVYDMAFGPDGRLYGGDNGWQDKSQGPPPEELNIFEKGKDYGFPAYLGPAPEESGTEDPILTYPPHTSPTGVAFLTGPDVPKAYEGDLLVAFYGPDTWEKGDPATSFRIIRHKLDGTTVTDTVTFASQFYRPVDILVDSSGAVLVADLGNLNGSVKGKIYRITADDTGSPIEPEISVVSEARLENHPNPFAGETAISGAVDSPGHVRLEIVDLLGRPVRTLIDESRSAGPFEVIWDGADSGGRAVASGIYFYRLFVDGRMLAGERMVLLR